MDTKKVQTCPSRCEALTVGGATYRSVYDCTVMTQDLEKARRELNERDEEKEGYIRKLRKRLEEDSKVQYQVDDHYLLCYLRFRKFDIDKAFNTIRNAHVVRSQHPEWFTLPSNLQLMHEIPVFQWLPYRDAEGSPILWHRFGKWNPGKTSFNELMQMACTMMDIFTMNPGCQIDGMKAIWDCREFSPYSWHLAPFCNPKFALLFISLWTDCYPERIKLILVLNCNRMMRSVFYTFAFLLKKKVRDRIKFLGSDVKEIHQYIDPVLLPKDLGGTIDDEKCSMTGHIMYNLPYLKHIRSLGTPSTVN